MPISLPRAHKFRPRTRSKCPVCAQTPTGGKKPSREEREAEIAAKIEALRRQKKLKSQKAAAQESVSKLSKDGEAGAEMELSAEESMYMTDIEEGEKLFGTGPKPKKKKGTSAYKPRVSTWGVFERPDNISRAFGGGRKLPLGGEVEQTEEQVAKDRRIREKLARFMGGSVEEAALEEERSSEIDDALEEAASLMKSSKAFEAARILDGVLPYATPRSKRGGEVRIALALAFEETGRRSDARKIYALLMTENRFNDIRRTAKRLSAGYDAMDELRVEEGRADGVWGFRGEDFTIPDLAEGSDRRYDIVISEGKDPSVKGKPRDKGSEAVVAIVVLAALVGIPALVVLRAGS